MGRSSYTVQAGKDEITFEAPEGLTDAQITQIADQHLREAKPGQTFQHSLMDPNSPKQEKQVAPVEKPKVPGQTLAEQSFGAETAHNLSVVGGNLIKGVVGAPLGLADMIHYGFRNNNIGGFKDKSFGDYENETGMAGAFSKYLDSKGVESADSSLGRVAGAGLQGIVGGPAGIRQMIASALGGVAAQTTQEAGGSPEAQTLAGLVAGHAPNMGAQAARRFIRGDRAPVMQQNIADFEQATGGQTPTLGQAMDTPGSQGGQRTIAGLAGSGHAIPGAINAQEQALGAQARSVVDSMAGRNVRPMEAGASFVDNLKNNFKPQEKAKLATGYKLYDTLVPSTTTVDAAPLKAFMEDSTAPIPGLENTSTAPGIATGLGKLAPAVAADLKDKLSKVLGPDGRPIVLSDGSAISVGSIKALKSRVGEMVETAPIENSDNAINVRQARALYGTLSEIEKSAALKADGGTPGIATKIWEENNQKTVKYFDTLEKVRKAVNQDQPEDVFRTLVNGSKEGDTKLSAAYSTLDPEGKQVLSAAILRGRVLKAPEGIENLDHTGFSVASTLTNFHKFSSEAQETILNGMGTEYKKNFTQILKVADKIKSANAEFGDYPKTGKTGLVSMIGGGLGGGGGIGFALGGPVGAAVGAAAGGLGYWRSVHGLAKLMVKPTFVKWLAKTNDIPAKALPMALRQLGQIAARTNDKDLADAAEAFQQGQE